MEQRFAGWDASAAYVGMRQIDPFLNLQANWSPVNGGAAGEQEYQYNQRTAATDFIGTMGTNTYDGLQTTVRRQLATGYQFKTTFTWSKALGFGNAQDGSVPYMVIPQYYRKNYGPESFNFPYMFSMTGIAPLPFGKDRRWARIGLASKLAGGWQLSGILTDHSGSPFTAQASSTSLNSPYSSQYANCISRPQQTGNHMNWYTTFAFATPATGTVGSCGTDSLEGPAFFNLDLGLQRQIPIKERFHLTIRADMFNATNHPDFGVPTNSVNSSTFMVDTSLVTRTMALTQRVTRLNMELAW